MKKKKESKEYYYVVEYASGILRNNNRNDVGIYSTKKLNEGQFIIVEHIDCGVFIGRVTKDITNDDNYYTPDGEYRYLKDINLDDWISDIERRERMEELRAEMERRFAEIDKKKKFEYYAEIDDDFRDLYLEYEDLNKKEVK